MITITKSSTIRSVSSSNLTAPTTNNSPNSKSKKSPRSKIKNDTISSRSSRLSGTENETEDLNLESQLVVIKKERKLTSNGLNTINTNLQNTPVTKKLPHTTLKYCDEFGNEIIVKSIMKKSRYGRRSSNSTQHIIHTPNLNKKSVKFIDEIGESKNEKYDILSMNSNNEDKNVNHQTTSTRPLAEVIQVESYRNFNIYGGGDRNSKFNFNMNGEEEDEAFTKNACKCSCIIF